MKRILLKLAVLVLAICCRASVSQRFGVCIVTLMLPSLSLPAFPKIFRPHM